jgi:hypothetical protein
MVADLTRPRLARLVFAMAMGPVSGPLALRAMACARKGDRLGALAYACAVPVVWFDLAMLAAAQWTH